MTSRLLAGTRTCYTDAEGLSLAHHPKVQAELFRTDFVSDNAGVSGVAACQMYPQNDPEKVPDVPEDRTRVCRFTIERIPTARPGTG